MHILKNLNTLADPWYLVCALDNCVNNCKAKSECDPGDFGSEFASGDRCPLNVCCSKLSVPRLTMYQEKVANICNKIWILRCDRRVLWQ